jgi:hypothetical protein
VRPEERYLQALLRAWDGALAPPAAPPACDWRNFLDLVRRHGVAHMARAGLGAQPEQLAPAELVQALDRMRIEVRSLNIVILDRLRKLADCLERAGVRFLILKGPVLLALLYRDLSERPMHDLDVLVRREDLQRTLEVLEEAGYQAPGGGERRFWERSYHHIVARLDGSLPLDVEVHWDLELRERYPIPLERVWAESMPFASGGCELRAMSLLDQFVFGAIHLARHFHQPRLIWLIDLRSMARRWELDWGAVAERARLYRARTPLWFMAAYEERVFGASALPERVRPQLRSFQRWLLRWLSGPRPLELLRDVARESRRIFATLLFFDRLADLARFLLVHSRRKVAKWSGLERIRRRRGQV